MSHIKARSEYHYWKATQPKKVKPNMEKITVEEALLFAEWLHTRYKRIGGYWYEKNDKEVQHYTTRELWELYQKFLGKKG